MDRISIALGKQPRIKISEGWEIDGMHIRVRNIIIFVPHVVCDELERRKVDITETVKRLMDDGKVK